MNFYGLKTCDTCRKAQKELRAAGREFTAIDVRADGVSADKLREWTQAIDWKKLLNTRSTTWRNLDAKDKDNIDATTAIRLMAANPTLIKRPVIEVDEDVLVGWTAEIKTKLGL
ncbi:Spx/MgsR family RNA polymerase-binding regulatory protein [bacterium AH-315-J19]|nr:Spx/MgsR family RNA polymerase-binding regulatory protein [Robiginitomaculum sp.]MBN4058472.1 Spx/MgsR family RNA polymerase-binding regulatory protein [bacterium AH-315-J19]